MIFFKRSDRIGAAAGCLLFLIFPADNNKAYSLSLDDFLPGAVIEELVKTGAMNRSLYGGGDLSLTPHHAALEAHIQGEMAAVEPNVTVESLRLYTKPPAMQAEQWGEAERGNIYNNILALKSLTGIQYFSRTRGRMRTLYEKSELIDGPDTKKPLPDPVYSVPPPELRIYARQRDTTFGDNIYQYTYYADAASFIITQQNVNMITLGPLPVIRKNNLRSCVAVIDAGHHLIIYMSFFVRTSSMPGIRQQMTDSINYRTDALISWFAQRADLVYKE